MEWGKGLLVGCREDEGQMAATAGLETNPHATLFHWGGSSRPPGAEDGPRVGRPHTLPRETTLKRGPGRDAPGGPRARQRHVEVVPVRWGGGGRAEGRCYGIHRPMGGAARFRPFGAEQSLVRLSPIFGGIFGVR